MKKTITLLFIFMSLITQSQIFSEGFEDVSKLSDWDFINTSEPMGSYHWQQGTGNLGSYAGSETSYIATNAQSALGTGTNSDWFILPTLSLKDGDKLSFYTKASKPQTYADRLEVRLSTNVESSAYPTGSNSVGDFKNVLLEINPNLLPETYPTEYTQYMVTISGLGTTPINAKIAFRYYVTEGGPEGPNGNGIAIDSLEITNSTLSTTDSDTSAVTYSYNNKSNLLTITSKNLKLDKIELYDLLGKNILNRNLSNTTEHIDINHLSNSIYIVKAYTESNVKTFKFLKF